ncbi:MULTISPECIES: MFS transporter [unclassified Streptomyces]|uniref:MFS transporter n=1 Tax=unclassified Streptomyces TaxID=2593676 RepID=UPI0013705B87|nr:MULTISPECIES: MFS transporter [unclassified Streptomyces]NDZ99379.1 MFS transporter [Streptomyces sp. SID10116]MYY85266.1 MFS transporter [Streptomyces sp. SID335]MYZ17752.1 MFS transporter [Streptomyces sp. SID337]NDZ85273.1 MFS transporter [Streptomyces sp. SID10115]NEB46884.1 MFS transporter [Streptomyces sp. SID339]
MTSLNTTDAAFDPSGGEGPPGPSPSARWLAVAAVTMGIFSIVTTEILPIGLLDEIGSGFGVSDGTAGLMMTMPGLLAAVCAPLTTAATARVDRRLMLCLFMSLLLVANLLVAAAPGYWLVLVSRVLVGVVIGGFWSIAIGLAERLVPSGSVRRATAVIFSAVPLGSVLGVPAGTFIGNAVGWRTAFVVMSAFTLAVLILTFLVVPPLPPTATTGLRVLSGLVKEVNTRFALLLTFLVVLAHFGTYTYVAPFLHDVTGAGPHLTTVALLAYGVAGIAGNFLGGTMIGRNPRAVFGSVASVIAAVTLLLPVAGRRPVVALVLLIVWGLAYGAVPLCSQTWFIKAAPAAPEAASVLFTASFQASLSLGALAGGAVLDRTSPSAVMVCGGLVAVLTVLAAGVHFARRLDWPRWPGRDH